LKIETRNKIFTHLALLLLISICIVALAAGGSDMNWFKRLLGLDAVQGDCVPRAMFNAMAWAIKKKRPVWIADVKGHWQAVGLNDDGEIEYLRGNGWNVWLGDKEGDHSIYKLRTLEDAVQHFIRHNPWATVSPEEQAKLDKRIRDTFGTDPKDVE
jgi:hypothetical protein